MTAGHFPHTCSEVVVFQRSKAVASQQPSQPSLITFRVFHGFGGERRTPDMTRSLDDVDDIDTLASRPTSLYSMNSIYEQTTLDGVIFIGLCVMCAGILLMSIKLCYNYVRHFPTRKDSELLGITMPMPKPVQTTVRYSIA
ncbi:unnamed protein product [Heligmosomoides polygyrus]|uniref:Uncharacterized protein n=1 Tax=Heligmosomoides polygyrus TaxID=6339 RepID=A0A3P8DJ31_HELPZ|nr:unnamed protein product [Heligmosomoides polygyrus]